jgi:hypothetical protein
MLPGFAVEMRGGLMAVVNVELNVRCSVRAKVSSSPACSRRRCWNFGGSRG